MKYSIVDQNFSEIREIRFGDEILRKAGSSYINDPDFIETDFKYFQDKLDFSDPSVLSLLDDSDKVRIGEGAWGEEAYFLTLFPTLIPNSESSSGNITYFSTYVDTKGTEILCVVIPEGIQEVKMYEVKNNSSVRPSGSESVVIQFEDTSEKTEIEFSKVLWLITSYDENTPRIINLSYVAYQGDKNPNRRMSDYVLRNDGFVENYRGTKIKDGYLYSEISGSLIGTEELENRPIFNLVSNLIGNNWNKRKRYSIGDIVVVGSNQYQSLESNNIGNHPYYSRKWVKKEVI